MKRILYVKCCSRLGKFTLGLDTPIDTRSRIDMELAQQGIQGPRCTSRIQRTWDCRCHCFLDSPALDYISKRSVRAMLLRLVIRWIQTYGGIGVSNVNFEIYHKDCTDFLVKRYLRTYFKPNNWLVQFKRIALHKNHVAFLCIKISLIFITEVLLYSNLQ